VKLRVAPIELRVYDIVNCDKEARKGSCGVAEASLILNVQGSSG
jgi:hypothetical protein